MPQSVFVHLGHDNAARNELDAHWFDCSDHLAGMSGVVDGGSLAIPLATNFLGGADAMLDSAAASLLSGKPNVKAAEHARFAFESALKALAAERGNMTEQEARSRKISHHLDKLLARCRPLFDPVEHKRLQAARTHFPDVRSRYANQPLPGQQLWTCYAEARHASATVLRALGGPDTRQSPPP